MHAAMEALKTENGAELAFVPIRDKEQAALVVKNHAHLMAQMGVLIGARDKATAKVNEQLVEILNKHQPAIDAASKQLTILQDQLKLWAEESRTEFGEKQSLEFSHGTLSFRLGQRRLEPLARWDMEKVLKKLQRYPVTSQWREYIRKKESVNEQKLLMETKDGGRMPAARLKEIGLKIVRDESFTVEPNSDAVARDCDVMP